MDGKNITINITSGSIARAILFVLLVIFLYMIRDIVAIVLFSVVIASGIEPATNWFQKRKIPRVPSVIILYLIAFLLLGVMIYLIAPVMFSELSTFASNMPLYLGSPLNINFLNGLMPDLPVFMTNAIQDFTLMAADYISSFAAGFFQAAAKIFGGAVSFFLIIIISFYLAIQKNGIENFLRIVAPVQYEEYIIGLWTRSSNKIGKWLQGQILLGLVVGVLVFLGLTILGVDYALTFALLAAVFEIIPVFGPILASVPAIIFALIQSPVLAIEVAVLYFIVQQFENHLIYPLVVRKIIGIPPIMTILAIVIGGSLGGFFGILLAVPVVTVLVEVLDDIELKKHPRA